MGLHGDRRLGSARAGRREQSLVRKIVARKFPGDAALAEDENAIPKHARLFDLRRGEQYGEALRCEVFQDAIDLPLCVDIDAASWFIKQKNLGRSHKATRQQHFLLIAS